MEKRYHMRRTDREITERAEIDSLLKQGKYVSIAMCRDNHPYLVTLSYGYDQEGNCLYLHTGRQGLKLEFLKENSSVCASVVLDGGYIDGRCAHRYRSAVLFGTVAEVLELEEKKHGLEIILNHLEAEPEPIRARTLPNDTVYQKVTVLRIDIETITGKQGQ